MVKLRKDYGQHSQIGGRPLVIAMQDFNAPMSMTWTRTPLAIYLYGYRHVSISESHELLTVRPERVKVHKWNTKIVPPGLFRIEQAESISAVLFNSNATLSKKVASASGQSLRSPDVLKVQQGYRVNYKPNARTPTLVPTPSRRSILRVLGRGNGSLPRSSSPASSRT